jgi:hypothetical protein
LSVASLQRSKHAMTQIRYCATAGKQHVTAATVTHATTEELLQTLFSIQSVPRLYLEPRQVPYLRHKISSWCLCVSMCIPPNDFLNA